MAAAARVAPLAGSTAKIPMKAAGRPSPASTPACQRASITSNPNRAERSVVAMVIAATTIVTPTANSVMPSHRCRRSTTVLTPPS
jgi:hypothetical protein